jgi:hypothetical protein
LAESKNARKGAGDPPALLHRGHDGREVVVRDHERRGLTRGLRSGGTHGDPDIGLPECRCIIDAVTCDRDDLAGALQGRNELELVGGREPCVNRIWRQPELARNCGRGERVVAREHLDVESERACSLHRGAGHRAKRIGEADEAERLQVPLERLLADLGDIDVP